MKHIIWSNFRDQFDDQQECKDAYIEHCAINDIAVDEDEITEDILRDFDRWLNDSYLDDERANLTTLSLGKILVCDDYNLVRYGAISGYDLIDSGNISDCLYDNDCPMAEWYCDDGDFRFHGANHDGCRDYLYRLVNADADFDERMDAVWLASNTTSLVPHIAAVYGWTD